MAFHPPAPRPSAPARTVHGSPRTLGRGLGGHDNALNLIRLVLASAVIVGHSVPVGGYPESVWQSASGTAVNGFFVISGYLIAGSRMRLSLRAYLWRRALRIYPGFWVSLAVTAVVVAPVAAALGGERYEPLSALAYVVANATLYISQWDIQHLLEAVPFPNVWNASLWTLWLEGAAYLLAGLVLTVPRVRRRPLPWLALLLVLTLVMQFASYGPVDLTTTKFFQGFRLGGFFLAGMVLWAARDRVPLRWWLGVPALALALVASSWPVPVTWAASALPLAYGLLWLGAVLPVRIGAVNDLSYGTYIYAFPLQQLLVVLGANTVLTHGQFSVVALACTLPVAWLSWHLVEKPALKFKTVVT
ncbi:acyltransferase [Kocuria sp.]|uniref:acyltransferase family protein n=1 Tax=Kocuria sp. TaxID=1871328 RepID=UPI0026DC95A0|nr:acyltransferase [Kocuria sp.]MDO4918827.1 acyltransferase [Kocuria sp.]